MRWNLEWILTLLIVIAAPGWAEDPLINDGQFVPTNYETITLGDGSTTATTEIEEIAPNDPNSYRKIVLDLDIDEASLNAQIYEPKGFHPAIQGPVQRVRLAYDVKRVSTNNPDATQVAKGIAVTQDGVLYRHLVGVSTSTTWEHVEVADIVPLFPDVNWADGGPIRFGFFDSASAGLGEPFVIAGGYDNFVVDIEFTPSLRVPFFDTGDLFINNFDFYRFDVSSVSTPRFVGSCRLRGSEGIAFDADGNLYMGVNNGIKVFDRNWQQIGHAVVVDPVSTRTIQPAIGRAGQVFALNPVRGTPPRVFVFDATDPTQPIFSHSFELPVADRGTSDLAFDENGALWVSGKSEYFRIELDATGHPISIQELAFDGSVGVGQFAFQPSTGLVFDSGNGSLAGPDVHVVDPDDTTTILARITGICDSTQGLVFDSRGNLVIACLDASGVDFAIIPAASLDDLTGSVSADSLGVVRVSDPAPNGGKFVALKPAGRSREPFAIDAESNTTILSSDQYSTSLSGTATSNPLGETFRMRWILDGVVAFERGAATTLPLNLASIDPLEVGEHTFTLEVEGCMLTLRDTVIVTVENSPPTAAPIGGGTYELGDMIAAGGQAADYDGDELLYEWRSGATILASGTIGSQLGGDPVSLPAETIAATALGVGVHTLELAVDDGVNDEVVETIVVEVLQSDVTAPTCSLEPSTAILWPPNHSLVDVTIAVKAEDDSGGPVTISLSVTSSEPPDDTEPDIVIVDDGSVDGVIDLKLRSEREGVGNGRIYTALVTVTDVAGNSSACEVEVQVPHDRKGGQ